MVIILRFCCLKIRDVACTEQNPVLMRKSTADLC